MGSSKGKRRSEKRKVREGLADARETSGGEENIKTVIVVKSRGEIEIKAASAMFGPRLAGEERRLAGEERVKSDDKLAGGVDGVGGKVERHTEKTMMSREGRVEAPRAHED